MSQTNQDNCSPAETCPAELPNFCAKRHWSIFWILILCSFSVVAGRIVTVQNHSAKGESAFFSANDRSRWCTIRSLVDEGNYDIDECFDKDQAVRWDTIDCVRHIGEDGQFHFYSSKPTLLPTMYAGAYWVTKSVTGMTLEEDTLVVSRIVLFLVSAIPWGIFLYFVALTINSIPVRDWARYFVLACAGFGTFLSTFSVSLTNHLPAAYAVMIALYGLTVIWRKPNCPWYHFASVGLFSALAFACELPALSFFGLAGLICLIKSPRMTFISFVPAAALIGAGIFGTNYMAHGEWKPAYAHRSDGKVVATVNGEFNEALNAQRLPTEIANAARDAGLEIKVPSVNVGMWPSTPANISRWVVRDELTPQQFAINQAEGSDQFEIREWGNWYDYPGSYWLTENNEKKSAVDRGQPDAFLYAFHVLFGHHGILSLTPIWLLSFAGMFSLLFGIKMAGRFQMRWLGAMALILTIVVIGFYLNRPAMDRNYGGVTSGLRWVFWLAPIWIVTMLPVVDWLGQSKWGRGLCFLLLGLSTVSALASMDNPWVNPWLYEIWESTGLPK